MRWHVESKGTVIWALHHQVLDNDTKWVSTDNFSLENSTAAGVNPLFLTTVSVAESVPVIKSPISLRKAAKEYRDTRFIATNYSAKSSHNSVSIH